MTILDKIVAHKKKEISAQEKLISVAGLEKSNLFNREIISLSGSLLDKNKTGIIAEFKRRSPSKGIINSIASVEAVTSGYFREGASGVSVLTDNQFFGGSNADLLAAGRKNRFPILRKDFMLNEFQIIESRSIGADVILLIAAILSKNEILNLSKLSRSLGMEVLLEIHEQDELDKLNPYINMVGVNNRNLRTFEVNTETSLEIAGQIPEDFIMISESGISSAHTIKSLKIAGFSGFLIGEKFMSSPDPVSAFTEFVKELK